MTLRIPIFVSQATEILNDETKKEPDDIVCIHTTLH